MHGFFGEDLQIVPIKTPAATTADTESNWVKLENCQQLGFLVQWGAMGAGSTDTYNIAVKSTTSTASGTTNANDYALPFNYRLLAADITTSTDTYCDWGAITAATTATGYAQITADQQNRAMLIDVDPAIIYSHDSDATFVYVDIDAAAAAATDTNYALSVVALIKPRYPQNENLSSS
jgi:hypothetical protein